MTSLIKYRLYLDTEYFNAVVSGSDSKFIHCDNSNIVKKSVADIIEYWGCGVDDIKISRLVCGKEHKLCPLSHIITSTEIGSASLYMLITTRVSDTMKWLSEEIMWTIRDRLNNELTDEEIGLVLSNTADEMAPIPTTGKISTVLTPSAILDNDYESDTDNYPDADYYIDMDDDDDYAPPAVEWGDVLGVSTTVNRSVSASFDQQHKDTTTTLYQDLFDYGIDMDDLDFN